MTREQYILSSKSEMVEAQRYLGGEDEAKPFIEWLNAYKLDATFSPHVVFEDLEMDLPDRIYYSTERDFQYSGMITSGSWLVKRPSGFRVLNDEVFNRYFTKA